MSTDIQDLQKMIINAASKITSLEAENEALRAQLSTLEARINNGIRVRYDSVNGRELHNATQP